MSAIMPALLCPSLEDFAEKVNIARTFPSLNAIHVDFADNRFVANQTIMPGVLPSLPLQYVFQAHLMVFNGQDFLPDLQRVGFESVVFHFEAFNNIQSLEEAIAQARELSLEPGIALKPKTELGQLKTLIKKVDSVLIMAVEPGFYGSKYIPDVEAKVKSLRLTDFYGTIYVDGGISKQNIHSLINAGADKFIVGSSIFTAQDPLAAYQELVHELGE